MAAAKLLGNRAARRGRASSTEGSPALLLGPKAQGTAQDGEVSGQASCPRCQGKDKAVQNFCSTSELFPTSPQRLACTRGRGKAAGSSPKPGCREKGRAGGNEGTWEPRSHCQWGGKPQCD